MKTLGISIGIAAIIAVGVLAVGAHGIPGFTKPAGQMVATTSAETVSAGGALATSTQNNGTTGATGSGTHPAPTPAPKPLPVPPQATSGIGGTVTIGPTCPVQKDPPDPSCADKPYPTTLVIASTIIGRNGGVLVKTDAQGHFEKALPPGTYTIRSTSDGKTPPTLSPMTVVVKEGEWTRIRVQFDSGIR